MALIRVSVDGQCKDGYTCPSVWVDGADPGQAAIVVGVPRPDDDVPCGRGERAVWVRRQVLDDAGIRTDSADATGHVLVVGALEPDGTVPLGPGELAVRVRITRDLTTV